MFRILKVIQSDYKFSSKNVLVGQMGWRPGIKGHLTEIINTKAPSFLQTLSLLFLPYMEETPQQSFYPSLDFFNIQMELKIAT